MKQILGLLALSVTGAISLLWDGPAGLMLAIPLAPLAIGAGSAIAGAGIAALTNKGDAEEDFFSFMGRFKNEFFPGGFGLGAGTISQFDRTADRITGQADVGEVRGRATLRSQGRSLSAQGASLGAQSATQSQRALAKLGADLAALQEQTINANRGQFLTAGSSGFAGVNDLDLERTRLQQEQITGGIGAITDPIAQYYMLQDLRALEEAGGGTNDDGTSSGSRVA